MSTEKTTGKSSKMTVAALRDLLALCKEYNVLELDMNGVHFKVDVAATMVKERQLPTSLMDDTEQKVTEAKRSLSDLLADSAVDERWSV